MADLQFTWDPRKARDNVRKHGVSFEEAQSVFLDDYALLLDDPDHSGDEDRFLLLGVSSRLRTVVVCHCYKEDDQVIRLISARKCEKAERRQYDSRRKT